MVRPLAGQETSMMKVVASNNTHYTWMFVLSLL